MLALLRRNALRLCQRVSSSLRSALDALRGGKEVPVPGRAPFPWAPRFVQGPAVRGAVPPSRLLSGGGAALFVTGRPVRVAAPMLCRGGLMAWRGAGTPPP